jgi:hypothetical protein
MKKKTPKSASVKVKDLKPGKSDAIKAGAKKTALRRVE